MATVLDEVTTMSMDAPYVQRRVDDWIRRLSSLYGELNASLPEGWSTESATLTLYEEPMRRFKVPPATLPALLFAHETGATANLEPQDLWVIGANGRLSLTAGGHRYIVLDTAEIFAPPAWEVCPAHDRWNREPFTPDWLRRILSVMDHPRHRSPRSETRTPPGLTMSTRTASPAEYFVCVENADYPVSLELHKIYRALPDEDALAAGDLRIVDESGEDYLYPATAFVGITLPERVRSSFRRGAS